MRCVCTDCGAAHEAAVHARINVEENPELKEQVKDGSLFVWECPHCGKANLVRYQTLYHDPGEKLMIWLLPEGSLSPGQAEAVERALSRQQVLEGYLLRRVSETGSLIEKVHIFDCGLEDTVMEMVKYVTRMELAEKDGAVREAPLKFFRMESPDNELILSFPHGGQMQMVGVGFHVYEDCRRILQRNPSVQPPPGFACIDADWLGRYFR